MLYGGQMDAFMHVNEESFERDVLKADKPVVVEFGATWCQPCKQLEPVLVKLSQEWGGKVQLVKVDVDESANLTMQQQIMGVPTVILFIKGQATARFTGYQDRNRILDKFKAHLG
jgi:thioredoxin 1